MKRKAEREGVEAKFAVMDASPVMVFVQRGACPTSEVIARRGSRDQTDIRIERIVIVGRSWIDRNCAGVGWRHGGVELKGMVNREKHEGPVLVILIYFELYRPAILRTAGVASARRSASRPGNRGESGRACGVSRSCIYRSCPRKGIRELDIGT